MKKILLLVPFFLFSIELKIGSYNVDNFFDIVYNKTEYKEYIPNTHNWNRAIFNKKIKNIAHVICELDADVLGLQEIENKNALNLLLKYLNKVGCKYKYSAITHKKGSAVQVALISKVPIKRVYEIKVSYSSADRNILEVTLHTNPSLKIFINHWRSKKANETQRIKYAKALVKRLKTLPSDSEYIILGDFNSEYNECIKEKKKKICGIDGILKTTYNNRLIKLTQTPTLKFYHYNLWSDIDAHKRWSYGFFNKKEALDSIIISPTLNDNKNWSYKKRSFNVFKPKYLFKKNSYILNRWEYKNSKHTGKGYSDHLPIYALFTNGKKELKHESWLDKFWKIIIPEVKENRKINLNNITIKELKNIRYLKDPVILKDICVIYKRGDFGVIKDKKNKDFITLYKSAEGLEEGRCYDFKVNGKKRYFKLDEITDLDILKTKDKIDIEKYIKKFTPSLLAINNIGEIVKNIKGEYNKGYININGNDIKLFVKVKKRGLLKSGNILNINRAQIGYYKGEKELIVYSLKDIKKEE